MICFPLDRHSIYDTIASEKASVIGQIGKGGFLSCCSLGTYESAEYAEEKSKSGRAST